MQVRICKKKSVAFEPRLSSTRIYGDCNHNNITKCPRDYAAYCEYCIPSLVQLQTSHHSFYHSYIHNSGVHLSSEVWPTSPAQSVGERESAAVLLQARARHPGEVIKAKSSMAKCL